MNKISIRREAGMVSILVTMVMMVVISLIVLGFAEISRTEQRNSTDDQLSTQAYYAAESGINDARAVINTTLTNNPSATIQNKTLCQNDPEYPLLTFGISKVNQVNSSANVSYTCLLITADPSSLNYNVGATSTVIPISATNPVKELTLNWGIGNGFSGAGTCPATAGQFPPSGNWRCNFPVLRVDLVMAVNAGGSSVLSRTAWSGITDTMFFMPTTTGTSSTDTAIFSPPGGSIYAANCSSSTCTGNINNLGSTAYYMRVTALYVKNAPLVITNSSSQPFLNAQAIIDATGQAQDVLRRVVVAVDLTDANAYTIPSGALITENSVCKQFGVAPITEPYWPSGYFSSTNLTGGGNNNELCTTLNTP